MHSQLVYALVSIGFLLIVLILADRRSRQTRTVASSLHALDSVISGLLKRLTSETAADLGKTIESCLSEIVDILEAKRVCWYVHNEETSTLRRIYSARRPGIQPSPELIDTSDIPYTAERLMNRENFVLRSINDLPDEARTDRSFYEKQSIRGLMLIASNCGSRRVGILEISFEPTEVEIPEELVSRLSTLNNVIVTTVERKIAYNLLGESEKRFRGLVQNAPIGIVLENMDGGITFVNPTLCSMLDYSEEELLGMRCADFSDPTTNSKDEILFAKVRKGEIDRYTVEKKFIRKDGSRIWGRVDVALLRGGEDASPLVIGMLEDITKRKDAEYEIQRARVELEQLAGSLIQAQENERHRISRELHDDIGQRLSLLAVEIDLLSGTLATMNEYEQQRHMNQIKSETDSLITDVHLLSHRLHSSKLQHLGLRSAVEELVKQIIQQHRISIEVESIGRDKVLPSEVALCLFRVAQEALNNVIRHSKATSATIKLEVLDGLACLRVQDSGIGFEVSGMPDGIGLVNMRERLRLVGGLFKVESTPGSGTSISATVPFTAVQTEDLP